MKKDVGVINEIGDLGLGYDELSDKDKLVLREQEEKDEKPSKKDSN